MRPMGWCADLVLSSLDLLAIIAVIIPDVVLRIVVPSPCAVER